MEVYIGEIVNTHGIKGEVRIISNFKYKELVFKPGVSLYVGKQREKLTITTYRKHKNYDMVTFDGINDINDVLGYKGDSVFINREDIKIDGYVNEDIIGLEVYSKERLIGNVTSIVNNGAHEIIVIDNKYMVPFIPQFIENIDLENKKVFINEIEGLIDEN